LAEREIKTRIVLEGEQQFRQAMNNASSAVKALNAEEKACEAQFKATGDAEAYREEKTRILTEKLQEQQKAVEAARKAVEQLTKQGVEKNDRAMQTWRTKLANAQTAVANTQAKLQGLQGSLDSTSQAMDNGAQAAADYSAQLEAIGGVVNVEGAINSIDRITDTVKGAVKTVAGLGKKVWDLEADAAHWADDVITSATKTGLDVETYQAWDYAAQMVDTSIDEIIQAQTRMNNKVLKESPEVAKALGQVGVAFRDRDQSDVFWDTIRALNAMEDVTKRNNYAQQIFGNNYRNLLPLINKGADAWDAAVAEARENYVLNADQVGQLGDLDDSLVKLGASLDKTKMTVLAELAPVFSELAGSMAQAVNAFNDFLATDEGQQMIKDLGAAIGDLAMSFLDPGPEGFKHAVETAKNLLKGVTDAFKWLDKNKDGVKVALGVIAGGFAAFETAKGILNLIEAGKAVKNIFGAKGSKGGNGLGGGQSSLPGLDGSNVSTEHVGTQNVSSEQVGQQTVTTQTVTSESVTTSNVTTMYVQNMVGGNNGTPSNPTNPTTPTTPSTPNFPNLQSLPGNGATPLLNAGGGDGLNGYMPVLPSGGSGLSLPGGGDINIGGGSPTVNIGGGSPQLNLPSGSDVNLSGGGSTPIRLDPNEFDVTEAGKPQLRWPEDGPPQPEKPTDNGGGGFGAAAAIFAVWGAALYGVTTGLDHLLGDAQRAKDIEERENTLAKAEEAAEALGEDVQQDVEMLTRLANALGPAVDNETGEYKKNPFFSTYWEPTNELGAIIGDLGDIRKRGLLHADIEKWGARDAMGDLNTGVGWTPWALLQRYWGTYYETAYDSRGNEYQKHVDMPLEPYEVNALLEYLKDMYTRKLEDAMSGSVPAEAGTAAGEEFTKAADAAAGETAGQATGAAFAAGVIKGIDANMAALSAAASRMGAVMSQGIVAAGGAYGGGYSGVGVYGASGGVLGQSGIDAKIYMGRKVVGTMVADTVNRVMGAKVSAARR